MVIVYRLEIVSGKQLMMTFVWELAAGCPLGRVWNSKVLLGPQPIRRAWHLRGRRFLIRAEQSELEEAYFETGFQLLCKSLR